MSCRNYKSTRYAAFFQISQTPDSVITLLKNDKSATALDKDQQKIQKRIKKLKTRLDSVLENPGRYDKVYQVLQRLFSKKKDIDLYRKHKKRYEVRELAQKRFILGYPPRKKNDTSIGDAINWEWLIYVAEEKNADIWIVSRDGDYGVTQDNNGFLNDWLKQEFKERIHKKRKIILCPKLSIALREFEIPVTKEEEQEEERIILEESVSVSDSVSARVFRSCEQCGQQFEAKGDEKSCTNCLPEWLT
ncbi:MAG: DUF4935 domain-containing protein [Gammaproteobacteria bacterium (ex Lamellibrachia satsuma)]|nr:MAG: DUF4935 domain-containing protein [Gammaproteobacteria bacterium (ex Lamellibrachia satsuma)]